MITAFEKLPLRGGSCIIFPEYDSYKDDLYNILETLIEFKGTIRPLDRVQIHDWCNFYKLVYYGRNSINHIVFASPLADLNVCKLQDAPLYPIYSKTYRYGTFACDIQIYPSIQYIYECNDCNLYTLHAAIKNYLGTPDSTNVFTFRFSPRTFAEIVGITEVQQETMRARVSLPELGYNPYEYMYDLLNSYNFLKSDKDDLIQEDLRNDVFKNQLIHASVTNGCISGSIITDLLGEYNQGILQTFMPRRCMVNNQLNMCQLAPLHAIYGTSANRAILVSQLYINMYTQLEMSIRHPEKLLVDNTQGPPLLDYDNPHNQLGTFKDMVSNSEHIRRMMYDGLEPYVTTNWLDEVFIDDGNEFMCYSTLLYEILTFVTLGFCRF